VKNNMLQAIMITMNNANKYSIEIKPLLSIILDYHKN